MCKQEVGYITDGCPSSPWCWCRLWPPLTGRKKKTKKEQVRACTVEKLKNPVTAEGFRLELANRVDVLNPDLSVEDQWEAFSSGVNSSAETVLGRRRGPNKERWISSRTWKLIDKRKKAEIKRDQARTRGRQQAESSVYRGLDKEVKNAANWTRRTGSKRSAVRHKQQPTEMTLGCYTVWRGSWQVLTATYPWRGKMEGCSLQKKNRTLGGWNTSRRC